MFRRTRDDDPARTSASRGSEATRTAAGRTLAAAPARPGPTAPAFPAAGGPGGRADAARRPSVAPSHGGAETAPPPPAEDRRLVVGRDIRLKGEVTACDALVVEGTVELRLSGARLIQIAPGGVFVGTAEVAEAEISGRFEGDLTARERLVVRAPGDVRGRIRYGAIVVEAGGQVSGEIGFIGAGTPPPTPAAEGAVVRGPEPGVDTDG